jgi:hypothetical protein
VFIVKATLSGLALAALACLLQAAADTAGAEPDFPGLQKVLVRLQDAPIARDDLAKQSVMDLSDRVDALRRAMQDAHANSWWDTAAVEHLTAVMVTAATTADLTESGAILYHVDNDLKLKLEYCSASSDVAGDTRGLARVTVKALRNGEPVTGLHIYCNPNRSAKDNRPMCSFPSRRSQ